MVIIFHRSDKQKTTYDQLDSILVKRILNEVYGAGNSLSNVQGISLLHSRICEWSFFLIYLACSIISFEYYNIYATCFSTSLRTSLSQVSHNE